MGNEAMAEKVMNIVIIGAGGDGIVVAEAVRQCAEAGQRIQLAGFLDDTHARGARVCGVPVFGSTDEWAQAPQDCLFVPAIQKVRDMPRRAARLAGLGIPDARWGRIIHPSAVVARGSRVSGGVFIASFVTVQPGAAIGPCASIRSGANIGHDVAVEYLAYVGPNATLCGCATVGYAAHVGPNSVVLDGKVVGRFAVVGISSAVTKDVPEGWVVLGNPAQRVGVVAGSLAAAQSSAQPNKD